MTDEAPPPQPVFPNYPVVNPEGLAVAHPKQAKPLFKILNKTLMSRFKTRVSPVKKGVANRRKKKDI